MVAWPEGYDPSIPSLTQAQETDRRGACETNEDGYDERQSVDTCINVQLEEESSESEFCEVIILCVATNIIVTVYWGGDDCKVKSKHELPFVNGGGKEDNIIDRELKG